MTVTVTDTAFHVVDLEKRMPFHFGNVEVSHDPQLFLRLDAEIDGGTQRGVAMGGLIPSWFYKDPTMGPDRGFRNMIAVFRAAADIAQQLDPKPTPFDVWIALYARQQEWAVDTDHPPLLWSYGVSLVEQALLDAFCRLNDVSFGTVVRENSLGIDLGVIYEELSGFEPAALLPEEPRRSTAVRHTVGLTDPLTDEDLDPSDRLDDGLPQTLAEYVRQDGVDHFKIKLSADRETDATRLARIADVLDDLGVNEYRCTVDANEGYDTPLEFKRQWEAHAADPAVAALLDHVAYVEQPLARTNAFTTATKEAFGMWDDAPPVIIDESDDRVDSAGTALEYGYAGTSHKNCKGVFKGIANACLIAHRDRTDPDRRYVISAEDLTTVGPIELLQDLAVTATIGAEHVERNGHHYFRGLSAFPAVIKETLLEAHGDLYRRHEDGFVTLDIDDGRIELGTTVNAPFGVDPMYDTSVFTPLGTWLDTLAG